MKYNDDKLYATAELVKSYTNVTLQKIGVDKEIAESVADLCSTWFLRGYDYGKEGKLDLPTQIEMEL